MPIAIVTVGLQGRIRINVEVGPPTVGPHIRDRAAPEAFEKSDVTRTAAIDEQIQVAVLVEIAHGNAVGIASRHGPDDVGFDKGPIAVREEYLEDPAAAGSPNDVFAAIFIEIAGHRSPS